VQASEISHQQALLHAGLRSGDLTVGTFLNLGSPLAAEACAMSGFDWLVVDLEHGGAGEDALLGQLLASSAHHVPTVVRVESAVRIRAGRVLDLGAAGVMFPRLDSAADAAAAVRHLHYPPEGDRGAAIYNRAGGFGLRNGGGSRQGEAPVGIVQIETRCALEDVEAIAATPGVDVLFVGPLDLMHALDVSDRDAPQFHTARTRIVEATRAAGITAGIIAPSIEIARRYHAEGFNFIAIGSDSSFIASAARTALALKDSHT
jgi:2-dehydro-3-deoxyglucarate aldolase/4-hydroxy-2-oxoheptanedioate aldolase